jgi:hypothetical protein
MLFKNSFLWGEKREETHTKNPSRLARASAPSPVREGHYK